MRVIAQHNLWFVGPPKYRNYRLEGESMISVKPRLGLTDSSDVSVLRQEMQWLHRYTGRDGANFIYSQEWIRPDNIIDRNLNRVFLPEIEKTKAEWNIFYDPVLAMKQRGVTNHLPIDFSIPKVLKTFRSDLGYLWANYFEHPNYWRLRRKPVLYIWSAASGIINAENAMIEAQRQGIYLLGDVFGGERQPPPLDGYTGFVASTPQIQGSMTTVREIIPTFRQYYSQFGPSTGRDLIPALSPQYDDVNFRGIIGGPQTRVLATDRAAVEDFLRVAQIHSSSIEGDSYVFVGTTNNWAEGSTILPTKKRGPHFLNNGSGLIRIGHYDFQHLEAIQRVFFPRNKQYKGPKIKQLKDGRVRFEDCDLLGRLKFKGTALNRPKWGTGENLDELSEGRRAWRPKEAAGVVLNFKNLDGKTTRLQVRR